MDWALDALTAELPGSGEADSLSLGCLWGLFLRETRNREIARHRDFGALFLLELQFPLL